VTLPQTSAKKPQWAIQVAIVAIFKGDAQLVTLLGAADRVTDAPPEAMPKPYIQVGDHLSIPDDDLTSFGHETTVTIHVWTKDKSNKQGEAIGGRVHALLHKRPAAVTAAFASASAGHKCVRINNEFSQALSDPDPQIRHHVLRFRVVTAQLS
jgi:hypothetical protein